jgi:hypothetical protein
VQGDYTEADRSSKGGRGGGARDCATGTSSQKSPLSSTENRALNFESFGQASRDGKHAELDRLTEEIGRAAIDRCILYVHILKRPLLIDFIY